MKKNIRWITETAILLALLVTLQALTKPAGQWVTGSCVNTVLAVAALVGGLGCGITVAVISPVLAYLFNIAPQILVVPAIMVGNCVFVVLLRVLADGTGKKLIRQIIAWLAAAVGKFVTLYAIVAWLICGVLAETLLESGVMKPQMVTALPLTFGVSQLITALIGGGLALLMLPVLKKALRR